MSQITSSLSTQCFKEISKDTFAKYKKVRSLNIPLLGEHSLYSKDGVKYIVKELPSNQQFYTTRPCSSVFIHKYTAPKSATTSYIYPIIGINLQKVIEYSNLLKFSSESKQIGSQAVNQTDAAKEYANLLSRHFNSLQKALVHILKFLMHLTLTVRHQAHLIDQMNEKSSNSQYSNTKSLFQSGSKPQKNSNFKNQTGQFPVLNIPILLQCVYVHNGQLLYCYDTWMSTQTQIVLGDIREIENLFLENSQLKDIERVYVKQMKLKVQREKLQTDLGIKNQLNAKQPVSLNCNTQKQISLFSSLFKSFLLTLYIGSMEMNLRLYEWGEFSLSYQNLEKRLNHFKLRHNKLGNLLERVLLSQKPGNQEIRLSQILAILKDPVSGSLYDLGSSDCKSGVPSSAMKAPKRVTLAKKQKLQNFDNIQLCESVINNQRSSIASSLQYACNAQYQQYPFTQTAEFHENYQSCRNERSNSKKGQSVAKNRTLSNMVLKECNSLQKIQKHEILIMEEKDVFSETQQNLKNKFSTSTKKNKENSKTHITVCNSEHKSKPPISSGIKTVKKSLFTPKIINRIIEGFQNLSELSASSCCSLTKLLGLELFQTKSSLQEIILNKLSMFIVNQNWITKQYSDNSFYFGEFIDSKSDQKESFKRHGVGVYLFPSKDLYFGNWVNNLMQGHGNYLFQSGQVYSGQLISGHKQGFGTFWYSDGKKYEGFWNNDNKIGLGTVYFSTGNTSMEKNQVVKFLGEFKQGKKDNQVEGIFTGYGSENKIWSKSGILSEFDPATMEFKSRNKKNRFEGIKESANVQKLMNCSVSKYRELIDSLGKRYSGEVEEGMKQGFGVEVTNEEHFEGNFLNDERNGEGKLVTKDSMTIKGLWEDGMLLEYRLE